MRVIVEKISLKDLILLSPEKSTLQFGIGILGKGFNENVEALEPE